MNSFRRQTASFPGLARTFEKLEDRNMLTTVFLDFGDGFVDGAFTMSEEQYVSDLGGVQFGDSLGDDTISMEPFSEFTGSSVFGSPDNLRQAVITVVERAFEPFNVNVVELTDEFTDVNGTQVRAAATPADVVGNLAADPDNDAYVFVTLGSFSTVPFSENLQGIAALDIGNTDDSTALLHWDGSRESDEYPIANLILQQAGRTFGLEPVDISESLPAADRLLAFSEAMAADAQASHEEPNIRQDELPVYFSRVDLKTQDNIIAETQNSWEVLASRLGTSPRSFVSGTGAFDEIHVTPAGVNLVDVTVDSFDNIDLTGSPIRSVAYSGIDASQGLTIFGGAASDFVNIDANVGIDIYYRGTAFSDFVIVDAENAEEITHTSAWQDDFWRRGEHISSSLLDLGNGTTVSGEGAIFEIENAKSLVFDSTANDNIVTLRSDFLAREDYNLVALRHEPGGGTFDSPTYGTLALVTFRNIEKLDITTSDQPDRVFFVTSLNAPGLKDVNLQLGEANDPDEDQVVTFQEFDFSLPVNGGQIRIDGGPVPSQLSVSGAGDRQAFVSIDGVNSGRIGQYNDVVTFSSFDQIHAANSNARFRFFPGGSIDGTLTANHSRGGDMPVLDLTSLPDANDVTIVDSENSQSPIRVLVPGLFQHADGIGTVLGSFTNELRSEIETEFSEWKIDANFVEFVYSRPLGDDSPSIFLSAFESIVGSDSDELFTVIRPFFNGALTVSGGGGNDEFEVLRAGINALQLLGGEGNDQFDIGNLVTGPVTIVGEAGKDEFNFEFTESGARDLRLVGGLDNDILNIRGTLGDDTFDLNHSAGLTNITVGDQRLDFNTIETVDIRTRAGDDVVNFNAIPATNVNLFTNNGNDRVFVNDTDFIENLNIATGAGVDRVVIRKTHWATTLNLNTNNDDDYIFVGSTGSQNDGNLNRIRGRLIIKGGANTVGEDRLFVNDFGAVGDFDYRVYPTWIVNQPGSNSPTRSFAGINYDSSIELVRLEGSKGANDFEVIASFHTRYLLDGNTPDSPPGDIVQLVEFGGSGSQLTDNGPGSFTWTFTNGQQPITLLNIENTFSDDGRRNFLSPPQRQSLVSRNSGEQHNFMRDGVFEVLEDVLLPVFP